MKEERFSIFIINKNIKEGEKEMTFSIADQNNLRASLESYLLQTGTKQVFIAKKTNICPSVLCHFKKGRMQLMDEHYVALMSYLLQNK